MLETFSFIVVEKKGNTCNIIHYWLQKPVDTHSLRYVNVTHIDTKKGHICSGKHNISTAYLANEKMSVVQGNVWNRHIRKHLKELIFALCIEKTQIFASMGTSKNLACTKPNIHV